MGRTFSGSWQVITGDPLELQFWGYIGQHEGFRLDAEQPAQSSDEMEWRRWWEFFLTNSFGQLATEVERSMPGAAPAAQLQQASARWQRIFDPPDFHACSGTPSLQALCRHYWPAFHRFWSPVSGEKARMNEKLKAQLQRVDLNHLVRECLHTAGKRVARTFRLHVDFVYWPQAYYRQVSDEHIVLGGRYLEADQAEAFKRIVQSAICRLV